MPPLTAVALKGHLPPGAERVSVHGHPGHGGIPGGPPLRLRTGGLDQRPHLGRTGHPAQHPARRVGSGPAYGERRDGRICHPRPGGGRFNGPARGAWYAATDLESAHAEVAYHRTAELAEVGVFETCVQERLYLADFEARFHDVRARTARNAPYHDPDSYEASQALARELLEAGSNGVLFRCVRRAGGECVACFRPPLVDNIRPDAHFEYRWEGSPAPRIRRL